MIKWTTITELNNDYFIIEKAGEDGQFIEIGTVQGAGSSTSQLNYSFMDKDRNDGVTYYRIKQVDFDGKSSTGYVKSIDCATENVKIYPNPFNTEIKVELGKVIQSENSFIQITNALGQVMYTQSLNKDASIIRVNSSDYKKGLYFVTIFTDDKTITEKVIKN